MDTEEIAKHRRFFFDLDTPVELKDADQVRNDRSGEQNIICSNPFAVNIIRDERENQYNGACCHDPIIRFRKEQNTLVKGVVPSGKLQKEDQGGNACMNEKIVSQGHICIGSFSFSLTAI
ncbi:MAG: hypothetical protein J6P98_05015, partial [Clostridia bacterium]|nr:hypothetical protein [Clostridia bacterium]